MSHAWSAAQACRPLSSLFVAAAVLAAPGLAWTATCTFGPGWNAASGEARLGHFDPPVVSTTEREDVALKVKAEAAIDEVRLELASGGELSLTPYGGGLFCIVVSADDVLYDYRADDANHNFVGFVAYYSGGVRQWRYNGFINVVDERIPPVALQSFGADAQASPRVFNWLLPGVPPDTLGARFHQIAQRFYSVFPDNFDFLAIVSEPEHSANRYYSIVSNGIQGTGMSRFDNSAAYGSAGRLKGLVRYPIGDYFDLGESGTNHELLHHYANWLRDVPALQGVLVHWPLSTLARGLLSIADASGQGIQFPWELTPLDDGNYRVNWAEASSTYNDMELYLMGLIPASEVGQHAVFVNQNQTRCEGCTLYGPTATLRVEDVIGQYGPRLPAYPDTQRTFNVATIVVSMDRLLTPREMAFYDYFASRGEATEPLKFSLGFSNGTTLPFHLATGGRGSLVTSLGSGSVCASGALLAPGQTLFAGQGVFSCDGRFYFVYQGDGNLVLYRWDGGLREAMWWSGTVGTLGFAVMQGDGNLVIYAGGRGVWHTGTYNHPGASLTIRDGILAIRGPDGGVLWSPELAVALASVSDVSVSEGVTVTRQARFSVTLSRQVGTTVTVSYATADGTAWAGADYTARSGTLTLAPYQTTATITVPVAADGVAEGNETFTLTLLTANGATIGRNRAIGTITDHAGSACADVITLGAGEYLTPGQGVFSCDERFYLVYQGDGNLVLYNWGASPRYPTWWTGTMGSPAVAAMQVDGNLVIYDAAGRPVWYTNTGGNWGAYLVLQKNGNLVMHAPNGTVLWATWTSGSPKDPSVLELDRRELLDQRYVLRADRFQADSRPLRVVRRLVEQLRGGAAQVRCSGGLDRPVAEDEQHGDASFARTEVHDVPLLTLQAQRPPELGPVGLPLVRQTQLAGHVHHDEIPHGLRGAQCRTEVGLGGCLRATDEGVRLHGFTAEKWLWTMRQPLRPSR